MGLCGGILSSANTYEPLAKFFALSDDHLSYTTKSGGSYWHNSIQSAREQLATKGFIDRPRKPNPTASQKTNKGVQGIWILTSDGKRCADRELSYYGNDAQNRLKELANAIQNNGLNPNEFDL